MSTTTAAPANNDPNTLFAAVDGRLTGLGTDEVVFFHGETGKTQVMTRDVAHAFSLCRAFLPMGAHVENIMQAMPALKGQGEAVQTVLNMFVSNGLMESDVQFVERFMAQSRSAQAPISGLFIGAPASAGQLQRSLDAVADHAKRFDVGFPVYVIDLAADSEREAEHAGIIRDAVSGSGLRVRHVTAEKAARIVDTLARALPDQAEALRWLLAADGNHAGAARNLAALLAAGTRYLFLNAESALPILQHPDCAPGLYADMRAFALNSYDSPDSVRAAGVEPAADPLAAHLDVCGVSLAEAMARHPDAVLQREGLEGVVATRAPWLKPEHRVAFTAVGRAGRFAPFDPTFVFKLGPAARAGFAGSRETYLDTYKTPSLWAGLSRFGAGLGEQLQPLAYDGSQLVPCTLPDAVKAAELQTALIRLAHPDSVDFDFPQAVMQLGNGAGPDDELGRPDSAQCIVGIASVVAKDLYAADPARRLAVMAAKLDDMAGGTDSTLLNYLSEYLVYHRSANIEHMQNAIAGEQSPPVYWLADARAAIEAQAKALMEGETPRLAGWPKTLDESGCVTYFRKQLQNLAAGLQAWPAAYGLAQAHSADWRDELDA